MAAVATEMAEHIKKAEKREDDDTEEMWKEDGESEEVGYQV
jgi:hypothetical protein